MGLRGSTTLQIACGLLLLVSCVSATPKLRNSSESKEDYEEVPKNHRKQLDDEIDLDDVFDAEKLKTEQLPFLPPLILLDFVNGTEGSNITESGDDKSKRTIDSNLGYGFNTNNILSGKHKFYFPSGNSGTAVSIDESISPFEPQTITELIRPESDIRNKNVNENDQDKKATFEALPDPLPLENGREPPPLYPPFPMFGQRTKLQKVPAYDYGHQQARPTARYPSSYATISGMDSQNKLQSVYTAGKPTTYQSVYSGSGNLNGYARPVTSQHLSSYMADTYSSSTNQKQAYDQRPISNYEINPANYPKYTVENGIKYEHKIVWKYPDGKISETPPMSYMNSYAEYADQQRVTPPVTTGGFRPSTPYQPRPSSSQQSLGAPGSSYNPHPSNAQSNIYSQKPVQFPNDQEQPNNNQAKDQIRFSGGSYAGAYSGTQYQTTNPYNTASYQGYYGQRQSSKSNGYKTVSHYGSSYQPSTKYTGSTQGSDFAYQGQNQNIFTANGQLNQEVLSKYSPEAQSYLKKVFAGGKSTTNTEYQSEIPTTYANTDYSQLLNYNPSISQYIKNPSSILNASPTFVQAGNSLIPVIILRVDGAPPIQPKVGSNVNLKNLLRQYLSQYVNSVTRVAQNANYNFETVAQDEDASASQANPVEDLKQLTQSLSSLRQRGYQDPDFDTGSYRQTYGQPFYDTQPQQDETQQHSYVSQRQTYSVKQPQIKTQNIDNKQHLTEITHHRTEDIESPSEVSVTQQPSATNYNGFVKDYRKLYAAGQQMKKKIKNVQIIEDPRYNINKTDQ